MTANEARSKSEDSIRTQMLLDTTEVNEAIKKAVAKGEFKIYYQHSLKAAAIDHLKSEGYRVEHMDDRNETYIIISW